MGDVVSMTEFRETLARLEEAQKDPELPSLRDMIRSYVRAVLKVNNGNLRATARMLKCHERTVAKYAGRARAPRATQRAKAG